MGNPANYPTDSTGPTDPAYPVNYPTDPEDPANYPPVKVN